MAIPGSDREGPDKSTSGMEQAIIKIQHGGHGCLDVVTINKQEKTIKKKRNKEEEADR